MEIFGSLLPESRSRKSNWPIPAVRGIWAFAHADTPRYSPVRYNRTRLIMARILSLLLICFVGLAACTVPNNTQTLGADGKPLPTPYKIRGNSDKLQFRMLDSVNALRQASGLQPVQLDARLNAAAATHARDMSVQNRPWHFGSDGSSPLDRVRRAGYTGTLVGEAISETYETELETLAAWMDSPGPRSVIMDPKANQMGFSWFQENSGKIWWTLEMGSGGFSS
ncbi:CAP domain-containing protein [Ruegeria sp. HKCCD8929]|uniref:CAP domain-containing protein n=1 Tax=Ruegeria sp. HKCCD8929 TaxID=2683006 RepID=UPI003530232D